MSIQNQIFSKKNNNIFNILDTLSTLKESYKDKILIFGSLIVLMFIFIASVQNTSFVAENPFLPRIWGAMIGVFLLNFGKGIYQEIKRFRNLTKVETFLEKTLWNKEFTPHILNKLDELYNKGKIHHSDKEIVQAIIIERRLQSVAAYSLSQALKQIVSDEIQSTKPQDSSEQSLHELAPNFFTKNC